MKTLVDRLTLTGAWKSGAATVCGLAWWWAWLWWPWWWCLVSGPPPAAACSAWTDIAARACRSRSRSRSRSTLKTQNSVSLLPFDRLYLVRDNWEINRYAPKTNTTRKYSLHTKRLNCDNHWISHFTYYVNTVQYREPQNSDRYWIKWKMKN